MEQVKQVYTIDEAAKMLGVSRGTAYECVKTGELPHIKLGRRIVVPMAAFERFLNQAAVKDKTSNEADLGKEH